MIEFYVIIVIIMIMTRNVLSYFVKFERGMILNIFFDKRTSMFFKILLGTLEMSLEIYVS